MKLFTKSNHEKLLRNGKLRIEQQEQGLDEPDLMPVVKLFTPDAACTWLLTELDPDCPDIAFGLCDLGLGSPELGSVCVSELQAVRGRFGLPVERDLHFTADKTLCAYADEARAAGHIKA